MAAGLSSTVCWDWFWESCVFSLHDGVGAARAGVFVSGFAGGCLSPSRLFKMASYGELFGTWAYNFLMTQEGICGAV